MVTSLGFESESKTIDPRKYTFEGLRISAIWVDVYCLPEGEEDDEFDRDDGASLMEGHLFVGCSLID